MKMNSKKFYALTGDKKLSTSTENRHNSEWLEPNIFSVHDREAVKKALYAAKEFDKKYRNKD